ncbi:hypothetical protein QWT87_11835 [Chryseobacterium sp. APV1]|uniref:DUF4280 domain-containing protein n=1 Tax=Chryseobacterium urinae TaxID=3058400 RepID=A0ABT8U3E7_9FLAO|nr:hypothetical protein [Chryseobacterium sp. APV1]MDO3425580.1 hypothetical protein [Chryseobacterium sp. APV1]
MGNKIITEKDFWMCSSGAMPAQLQGTRKSNKKSSGDVYITVADTATSSWIDFGCTKNMLLAALITAIAVVVVVALIVGTGGVAAIGLIGMMAIGAAAGVAGGIVAAVDGALKCGQKNATARTWSDSKGNLLLTGTPAITGDKTMTCSIGGVVKFAPEIKSWTHALALGGFNYVTQLAGCALGGAAVGAGGFLVSGLAGGSLAVAAPTFSSVLSNVAGSFTGIWGGSRALFGLNSLANEHAYGNVQDAGDAGAALVNGGVPEIGMGQRIFTGQAHPSDYLLFLYLLNIRAKGSSTPHVEEPNTAGDKDGNTTSKEEAKPAEENKKQPAEEEGTATNKPASESPAKTKKDGKGDAFAESDGKPIKPKKPKAEKPKPGSPEHKAARWEAYQNNPKIKNKKSYEEWSNRYEANMKNAKKGNNSADEYQKQLGWGDREVPMKIDENGNPLQVKKGQETRNLDIGDVPNKKAVEVKDYSSKKVPYDKDIKAEVDFDKKLAEKGWDVEWVFKDKGPSKALEEALNAPPPIKIKIIK